MECPQIHRPILKFLVNRNRNLQYPAELYLFGYHKDLKQ